MTIKQILQNLTVPKELRERRKKVVKIADQVSKLPFEEAAILFEAINYATKNMRLK